MNKCIRFFIFKISIASIFLLAGCKSSRILISWNYPSLNLTHYKKVLVIGLLGDKDEDLRQDMELDLASALNAHGMKTHSSYERYGPSRFREKDALPALAELKDSSYDAVVCIVLLDREKEKKYKTPIYNQYNTYDYYNNFNGPYFNAYDGLQNYYTQSSSQVYKPGYYKTTTKYVIEVIVFDFPKDSILYYAETKTKDPKTLENMSTSITNVITRDMVHKKILKDIKGKK